jgi:hypothetical protein
MMDDRDDVTELLAGARDSVLPSDALMARVLADAAAVQAELQTAAVVPGRGGIGDWLSSIGGWRGAGGLVAATITGLMIGVYAPDSIDTLLSGQLSERGLIEGDILISGWGDLLDLEDG